MLEIREIGNMAFALDVTNYGAIFVHIEIDGDYWDSHEFPSLDLARDFFNDPLRADREASQRKARRDAEREARQWPVWKRDPAIWKERDLAIGNEDPMGTDSNGWPLG